MASPSPCGAHLGKAGTHPHVASEGPAGSLHQVRFTPTLRVPGASGVSWTRERPNGVARIPSHPSIETEHHPDARFSFRLTLTRSLHIRTP